MRRRAHATTFIIFWQSREVRTKRACFDGLMARWELLIVFDAIENITLTPKTKLPMIRYTGDTRMGIENIAAIIDHPPNP